MNKFNITTDFYLNICKERQVLILVLYTRIDSKDAPQNYFLNYLSRQACYSLHS